MDKHEFDIEFNKVLQDFNDKMTSPKIFEDEFNQLKNDLAKDSSNEDKLAAIISYLRSYNMQYSIGLIHTMLNHFLVNHDEQN